MERGDRPVAPFHATSVILLQQLINGLAMGALYALVALGFTMVWNATGAVNFAQGEFAMVAMFVMLTLVVFDHWPLLPGIVAAVLASALIGVLVERFTLRPIRRKDPLTVVIITLGVSIVLSNGARFIWGTEPKPFPSYLGDQPVSLLGVSVTPRTVWIILIAVVLVAALQFLSAHTSTGRAMRAVAQDQEMASLLGISTNRIVALTFGVSAALAGVAGVLLAPIIFVSADIGLSLVLRAFIGAVIGGFGSYAGALLGGVIIGVVDNLAAYYVSGAYRDVITFALLVLVLLVRPTGLLGRR